jgi:hypothetical protein
MDGLLRVKFKFIRVSNTRQKTDYNRRTSLTRLTTYQLTSLLQLNSIRLTLRNLTAPRLLCNAYALFCMGP